MHSLDRHTCGPTVINGLLKVHRWPLVLFQGYQIFYQSANFRILDSKSFVVKTCALRVVQICKKL